MLIYYPECKLGQIKEQMPDRESMEDWYRVTFPPEPCLQDSFIQIYPIQSTKISAKSFAYIIEELMTGRPDVAGSGGILYEIINSVTAPGEPAS